mmetsp:Transcript_42233/g.88664  ORF Transcript_42233/g.88664 Transcript_42233/m.88664 type:complete len:156 (+) Transcript_42233:575-1042(+)
MVWAAPNKNGGDCIVVARKLSVPPRTPLVMSVVCAIPMPCCDKYHKTMAGPTPLAICSDRRANRVPMVEESRSAPVPIVTPTAAWVSCGSIKEDAARLVATAAEDTEEEEEEEVVSSKSAAEDEEEINVEAAAPAVASDRAVTRSKYSGPQEAMV